VCTDNYVWGDNTCRKAARIFRYFARALEGQFNALTLLWRCLQLRGGTTMQNVFSFRKDESGGTTIEYGLVVIAISLVVIAIVNSVGGAFNEKIMLISNTLGN
jgi:Flp pilus assembly pilin Flp